jgi:putative membrane protein
MNDQPSKMDQQPEDPRVRFAAERTLLAWMRTGLALMGFGFVVARFGLFLREIAAAGQVAVRQHSTVWSLWIGTALIGLGVAVSLLASFEYYRFVSWSRQGRTYTLAPHCSRSLSASFSPCWAS